jgi:antibiotic biosynthesis monooxygenase (ABM) superfamily enzyme
MQKTQCIRSAFWCGNIKPGMEGAFQHTMDSVLIPLLRGIPGVKDANCLWPTSREDNPPVVVCQVLVEFASRDDLATMLASPERATMRAHVVGLKEMFDGSLSHIEFNVSR